MFARVKRHALTLVELLVVVVILVILVAVVLPLAQPILRGREVREAARQVNTQLSLAQTRAAATNRAHGVMVLPDPNNTGRCFQLALVKSRGLFMGASSDSRVEYLQGSNRLQFDEDTTKMLEVLLTGDRGVQMPFLIRFDFRGDWQKARIQIPPQGGGPTKPTVFPLLGQRKIPASLASGAALRFQIQLPPRRSVSAGVELPQGAYIDLTGSGVGLTGAPLTTLLGFPTMFMFGAGGKLQEVWHQNNIITNPETLFLLVGNANDPGQNLTGDNNSLWVTVGNKTNRIATTENLGSRESALVGISAAGR